MQFKTNHACFKGDPAFHNKPGCFDGVEKCSEFGSWGPCVGGVHATDNCAANNMDQCHAIQNASKPSPKTVTWYWTAPVVIRSSGVSSV